MLFFTGRAFIVIRHTLKLVLEFQFDLQNPLHTPPEGGVRTKKCYITFDTIFGRYLPRGTIIDGSQKCRMGAFCTFAKNAGEMLKKGFKTGRNGVKFFFSLKQIEK